MPSAYSHAYFQPSPPERLANLNFQAAKGDNGETFSLPPFILPPPNQQFAAHRNSYAGLPPPGITHPAAGYSMAKRGSIVDVPPLMEDKPRHSARSEGAVAQQPQQEKPSGGVSAQLDYEIKEMADFVSTMSLRMYVYGDLEEPNGTNVFTSAFPHSQVSSQWRNFVTQILSSTRLPDSTILLAMEYLKERISKGDGNPPPHMNIHKLVTIALLLASKFLDDNTFQNKSWAEVTGIPVTEINALEMEWLREMSWNLHIDPNGNKGWDTMRRTWVQFKADKQPAPVTPPTLAPIDTKLPFQQSSLYSRNGYSDRHRPLSAITDRMFTLPSNRPQSAYWSGAPSPGDSPPSAPETGPPTPEYTGWPAQFVLPPPQYQSRLPATNFPPFYSHAPSPSYWHQSSEFSYFNGCNGCREPYAMHICGGHGNQAVVG